MLLRGHVLGRTNNEDVTMKTVKKDFHKNAKKKVKDGTAQVAVRRPPDKNAHKSAFSFISYRKYTSLAR